MNGEFISIETAEKIAKLEKENHVLQVGYNELSEVNKSLKEQLEYIRSGDYLKQVIWERDFNEKMREIYQDRIDKARKMIFDNYGVLDKYEIEILDDILKGDEDGSNK